MTTHSGRKQIVEELLAKPDAALVVEEVRAQLAREKEKRQEYNIGSSTRIRKRWNNIFQKTRFLS